MSAYVVMIRERVTDDAELEAYRQMAPAARADTRSRPAYQAALEHRLRGAEYRVRPRRRTRRISNTEGESPCSIQHCSALSD